MRLPSTTAAVKDMSWDDMEALFASTCVDEIACAQRDGGHALVRDKLAELTNAERNSIRTALLELSTRDHLVLPGAPSPFLACRRAGGPSAGPKKRALKESPLRLISEPEPELEVPVAEPAAGVATRRPGKLRPSLAIAAAENVEELKESLLQAAASATKQTWITVECSGCGERTRM